MVDLCEDMEIGRVNELIQAKMNETGLATRLIEHGITPKLVSYKHLILINHNNSNIMQEAVLLSPTKDG